MGACKVTFSLELLLELLGLKDSAGLIAYKSEAENNMVTLYLAGEGLPSIPNGVEPPQAVIICEKIKSKIEIID